MPTRLLAEREGFEPSIPFKGVYSLSRGALSTTQPSLQLVKSISQRASNIGSFRGPLQTKIKFYSHHLPFPVKCKSVQGFCPPEHNQARNRAQKDSGF